jgi:hypothetical protein
MVCCSSLWVGACCISLMGLETVTPLLDDQGSYLPLVSLIVSTISCLLVSLVIRLHIGANQQVPVKVHSVITDCFRGHRAIDFHCACR